MSQLEKNWTVELPTGNLDIFYVEDEDDFYMDSINIQFNSKELFSTGGFGIYFGIDGITPYKNPQSILFSPYFFKFDIERTQPARCTGWVSVSNYRSFIDIMAVKKSEPYSSLWASYDEFRGGMEVEILIPEGV